MHSRRVFHTFHKGRMELGLLFFSRFLVLLRGISVNWEKPEYRSFVASDARSQGIAEIRKLRRDGFEEKRRKPPASKTVALNEADEVWSATEGTRYEKTYINASSTRSSGWKSGNQDEVFCSEGVGPWVSFPKPGRAFLRNWKFRL